MRFLKLMTVVAFVFSILLALPAQADESWSEKARIAWERIKGIGDKSVETAEEIDGKKNDKGANKEHSAGEQDKKQPKKGWDRAKDAGGKALGSERSKHQRVDDVKSWKEDKENKDHGKGKSNGKGKGKSKGKGKGKGQGKGKGH
jgi:hypothetical protein